MFNSKEFIKTKMDHRVDQVPVDELIDFFDGDPIWSVRGLSHQEIALTDEHLSNSKHISKLIQALANDADKSDLIKHVIGREDGTPKETARRISMLTLGSVDPKIEMDIAAKLAKHHPTVFLKLTNKILELTGLGSEIAVKLRPSGGE